MRVRGGEGAHDERALVWEKISKSSHIDTKFRRTSRSFAAPVLQLVLFINHHDEDVTQKVTCDWGDILVMP